MTVPTTETPGVPSDRAALSGTYTIDASHSRIGFVTRHAMVTRVRGSFDDFEGSATLDGGDSAKSSARVVIQAASIDTRNEQRDGHLKSNDFFDMESYPTIELASTSARQADGSTFELDGDLTIKGVSKAVTLPFTFDGVEKDPLRQHPPRLRGLRRHQPQGLGPQLERPAGVRRRPGRREGHPGVRDQRHKGRVTNGNRCAGRGLQHARAALPGGRDMHVDRRRVHRLPRPRTGRLTAPARPAPGRASASHRRQPHVETHAG